MIRLTRSVSVSTFDVVATVAVGRNRPELLAVARLAADLRRPIRGADVLRELLGNRPEVLGRRVIERCVNTGLLVEKNGEATLSPAGRLALDHGEVLVPEEGVWRFFIVNDPLLPHSVVHAQRLETESAAKARAEAKSRASGPPPATAPKPIRTFVGAEPVASIQDGHLFQITELSPSGTAGPPGELRLSLVWEERPSVRVSGRMQEGSSEVDRSIPVADAVSKMGREALWNAMVASASKVSVADLVQWRAKAGKPVLPVPFANLEPASRHAFNRELVVSSTQLLELGRFDSTVLKGVDVVPASDADAKDWLHWLQWECIEEHVTPALLDEQARKLRARFPHHDPPPLSANELLARAGMQRDERSWFLLAPSDLGLWSSR